MHRRTFARIVFTLTLAACVGLSTWLLWARQQILPNVTPTFGVTFSSSYASSLGLDPHQVFLAVLDDLGARMIRLPIYWDTVEPTEGVYDFSDVTWYLDEAAKREAQVTLVVGMKVPRWPECHIPSWVTNVNRSAALLGYLRSVVTQFKDHPALARWQVENEPHFSFGTCPAKDITLFDEEIVLVRETDPVTPIQLTVSGEQELWAASAAEADILGTSLYRFAWNPLTGLVVFPHPPIFYSLQAQTINSYVDEVIISELQAEPWFEDGTMPLSTEDRYEAFSVERLQDNVRFAEQTQLSEVYLWGVEWWYALHVAGESRLWEAAKEYF